jgi:CheY-like chemotaxis protein
MSPDTSSQDAPSRDADDRDAALRRCVAALESLLPPVPFFSQTASDAVNAPKPSAAACVKGVRILVVEDDEINMRCLVGILRKWGHAATGAENGLEALRHAAQSPFDLILMDVQMPVMDGVEATRRIRSGEAGGVDPHIPIVAMTAHAMSGDREAFLAAGMDDYLAKPMDVSSLRQVISRVLDCGVRPGRPGAG